MEAWERIQYIMDAEGLNKNSLSVKAGFKQNVTITNVIKQKITPRLTTLEKIADSFPQYSRDWIIYGLGEPLSPLNNNEKDSKTKQVPVIPFPAQGGRLNDFTMSVTKKDCNLMASPVREADLAITIQGESMAPDYPNGSVVFIKKINDKSFIEWGKVYVLDTCNGVILKILTPSSSEDSVKCESINKDPIYASFDVSKQDIYGIYIVKACLSFK